VLVICLFPATVAARQLMVALQKVATASHEQDIDQAIFPCQHMHRVLHTLVNVKSRARHPRRFLKFTV
jgi:hypothetical protein